MKMLDLLVIYFLSGPILACGIVMGGILHWLRTKENTLDDRNSAYALLAIFASPVLIIVGICVLLVLIVAKYAKLLLVKE
jgi:uncharacterized membrane protein YidH (DUF202 family)